MKNYEIKEKTIHTGETKYIIVAAYVGPGYYFKGYDFMGSVEWETDILGAYWMDDREEAERIVEDLESADEPAEPAPATNKHLRSLQIILDMAISHRDDAAAAFEALLTGTDLDENELRKALELKKEHQAFLEGICTAIFAAGYMLQTEVDSTAMTVIK